MDNVQKFVNLPSGTTRSHSHMAYPILDANNLVQGFSASGGDTYPLATLSTTTNPDGSVTVNGLMGVGGGVMGITDAGLFGASPSASATVNTAAIQAALNIGGNVTLTAPGVFLTSGYLVIGNNTRFTLGANTTIKQANSTNKSMILPAQWLNYLSPTTVTPTWSVGKVCNVQWTNHGLSDLDYIWMRGAAQSEYNGQFRVVNVVDANNVKIILWRTPTASPSGTIVANVATRDFIIEGGTWDYNGLNNNPVGPSWDQYGMVLYNCAKFAIRNTKIINLGNTTGQRGITSGAIADYVIEGVTTTCTHVGSGESIKTYGPCANGVIRNCALNSTDDGSSIQTKDTTPMFAGQPFGDIVNFTFEKNTVNSYSGNASGAVPVYASDLEVMENVVIQNNNLYSDNGYGVVALYGIGFSTGVIKSLKVIGNNIGIGTNTRFPIYINAPVNQLTLDSVTPHPQDTTKGLISVGASGIVKTMKVQGLSITNALYPSAFQSPFQVATGAVVDNLSFNDCYVAGNASFMQFGTCNGTVNNLTFDNCDFAGGIDVWIVGTGAVQKTITVRNSTIANFNDVIAPQSTSTPNEIILDGNSFNTMNVAVINPKTGTGQVCTISGRGNKFTSAALVSASGSATFAIKSFDLPINVGQTGAIKTVSGQYCMNTTANGTLVANRLVTCNGTNWIQVDTPANLF